MDFNHHDTSAHKNANGGLLDPNDLAQSSQGPSTLGTGLNNKKTYYLETSAFLTGVNIIEKGPKKIDEGLPKAAEINQTHAKLNELVTDLGSKISEVIKDHENDFFVAFKNKMYAIMKEMRELKEKASSERHKAKQEARLINLEKERDWFRREALKLDKMCKDHKRILNKLKATLENIEEDRDFFQEQLFNAKKVNKALLMEVEKYKTQTVNGENLAITNGVGVGFGNSSLKYANQQYQSQQQQPFLALKDDFNSSAKKAPLVQSTNKLKSQINEALRQKPDDVMLLDEVQDPVGDLVDTYFKVRESNHNIGGNNYNNKLNIDEELDEKYLEELDALADKIQPSDYKYMQNNKANTMKSENLKAIENGMIGTQQQSTIGGLNIVGVNSNSNGVSIEEYRKVVQENADLKDRELKYAETIRHLKNQMDSEKKNARSLRAEKVNFMMQRNELEEFFLQCIEEVRKDIVKRKQISNASQQYGSSSNNNGGSTHKKLMKKSTSTASMTKQQDQDQQIPNAKLGDYTATDKRKVIELLMSNENVLLFLYEKLFPATTNQYHGISSQSTQSRQQTAGLMSMGTGVRFTTDSGMPIGSANNLIGMGMGQSALTLNNGRSSTSVGGSRLNVNRAHLNSYQAQAYGLAAGDTAGMITQNTLPSATTMPGMSIQNNIQNLNLNINLSKGAYGASQFLPQNLLANHQRGATAPMGQARTKKGIQAQLNALGNKNKYAL